MRKLFLYLLALIALTLCFFISPSMAQDYNTGSVKLLWDAPITGGPVEGYRILQGTVSGTHAITAADVAATIKEATVTGLTQGVTYYFVAVAYNAAGVSDKSNEVFYAVPLVRPGVPTSLRK